MTPEVRGRLQQIRLQLGLPELSDDEKKLLVREAVKLTREARLGVMEGVAANKAAKKEPKAPKKKAGDELLDNLLGASDEQGTNV